MPQVFSNTTKMGIQSNKLRVYYEANPLDLLIRIFQNNPEEVIRNLQVFTGQRVDPGDTEGLFEILGQVVQDDPDNAAQIIYNVFNAGIDETDLTPVEQEYVAEQIVASETRQASGTNKNLPFLDDSDLGQGDPVTGSSASDSSSDNGGTNWGAILEDTLPSVLGLFGLGGGAAANNNNQPQQQANNNAWVIWLVVFLALGVVAYLALKK